MTGGQLEGRIALITGASRGIGAAVARRFAAEGAQLVLVARTTGGLEEVDDEVRKISGERATLVPLDLTEYAGIDNLSAALYKRFGRLDALIGNAGELGVLSPMGHIDPETWDRVIAVNLTANWRLIRSFDPLLRSSDAGRAVFVTSTVGHQVRAYWSAYSVSKAALEMMVKIYAAENTETNIRANLLNPGPTRTAMRALAMPGEDPKTVKTSDSITNEFVRLSEPACTLNGETIFCSNTP